MPPPLNYRDAKLYVGGYRVKQLFVVSLAAEKFWRRGIHDHRGMNAQVWSDVVSVEARDVVRITGDGSHRSWRGLSTVELALTPADSAMGLKVACQVVELIEDHDYRVVDAIVEQRDALGRTAGVHDLVCEKRGTVGGSGFTSFEVKLRNLYSAKALLRARRQIQVLSWKLWPAAQADSKRMWSERVCLLLRWEDAVDSMSLMDGECAATYAESISARAVANGPAEWRPLWGWGRSLASAAQLKARAKAKARTKTRAKVAAKAQAVAKKAFDRVWSKCRKCTISAKEMRSVKDFVKQLNTTQATKVERNIDQRLGPWSRKWKWPADSYGQDKSGSCNARSGGGSFGYAATYAAMQDIYEHVK